MPRPAFHRMPVPGPGALPGNFGYDVFDFDAVGVGQTYLVVTAAQPWAGGSTATSSLTVTVVSAGVHRIAGSVTGASRVTIMLTGASWASTTTDASGKFSFGGLPDGSYTVTPSKIGYTFAPASLAVTVSGADVAAGSFAATITPRWARVQAVGAGRFHTCAIIDGGAWCWGNNDSGYLGIGSMLLLGIPVMQSNRPAQVDGLATGVQAIAAGAHHSCAIVNGGAWCWGDNTFGQLGDNSTTGSPVPVQVKGLTKDVQAIAAGDDHTCAIVGGGAWCWGANYSGQLGEGSTTPPIGVSPKPSLTPVRVQGLKSGVQAIAAGGYHSCAIVNGGVQCWGNNGNGQLGTGSSYYSAVPVAVPGLANAEALVTGEFHTCVLVSGTVECWGYNGDGQLGDGTTVQSATPVEVRGLGAGVQAISAGGNHTCAIVNGGARCWGCDQYGQLGTGSFGDDSALPLESSGLTAGVQAIDAGTFDTCAIVNGGYACWGNNWYGQLGNGSSDTPPPPWEAPPPPVQL